VEPAESLACRIAAELARPAPAAAKLLTATLVERHGDSVAVVIFYGSCLRKETHEGVLDFYVVVDDYRAAYRSRYLRAVNALVPPNVFYLSQDSPFGTLRCKYAVISRAAFERGVSPESRTPYFWARFSQPVLVTYARNDEARKVAVNACVQSVLTLVQRLGVFLPAQGNGQRFSPAALWQEALRRTYSAELRPESDTSIRSHYDSNAARYDAVTALALETLRQQGWLDGVEARGNAFEVRISPARRQRARLRWQLLWPLGKLLALVRLVKNATTFGDWVPYILWKLERHIGRPIEVTERQRRHPFLFGWPVLARLIWRREVF
jgi:hypothetical protein